MPIKCIKCGRVKTVKQISQREYRCSHCGTIFDDDPDEGGTHGHTPDYRIMKQEERRQRRLGRRY
ncbi:hypothetical protein [Gimesia fumaroli]|uniref:hypothetical protein n=1 Tax=Gimesia fumaroli TaxID=2527976 RepID=UPI0011A47688|nr:hypothetical protein [Gimesia fumaroli]